MSDTTTSSPRDNQGEVVDEQRLRLIERNRENIIAGRLGPGSKEEFKAMVDMVCRDVPDLVAEIRALREERAKGV